jgi:diguanylate cyclase (GGDEF)-like protein
MTSLQSGFALTGLIQTCMIGAGISHLFLLVFRGILTQSAVSIFFAPLSRSSTVLWILCLLICVYTIHQQLQIYRIRRRLTALDKVELQTTEIYKMAVLDPLTGLHNRRFGLQRLTEEMSRAERYGRTLIILLLDVDGLKQVNDTFGHPAGDQVIKHFAECLLKAIRGSDLAARIGGDEFLVLLPECIEDEVQHVLVRLRGLKIDLDGHTILFTFSVGWSLHNPGDLLEELMKRADAALYVNKRAGKRKNVEAELN